MEDVDNKKAAMTDAGARGKAFTQPTDWTWDEVNLIAKSGDWAATPSVSGGQHFLDIQAAELHGIADVLREDITSLLQHPIDTLRNIDASFGYAVTHPGAVIRGISQQYQDFLAADDLTRAYTVGRITGSVLEGGVLGGVGSVVTDLASVARYTRRMGLFSSVDSAEVFSVGGAKSPSLFRSIPKSAALNHGTEPITEDLVNAMRNKGRKIDIAVKGSDDYRYLKSIGAEGSINTGVPNHILIREDASKSTLLEEFLHGTQTRLGIVDRLTPQGAEINVKDFMIRN